MQSKNSWATLPPSSHTKCPALFCSENGDFLFDISKKLLLVYKVKLGSAEWQVIKYTYIFFKGDKRIFQTCLMKISAFLLKG